MMAATPASSKRLASSFAVSSDVSAQPSTATLPPLASMPTAMRLGIFDAGAAHERGVAHRDGAEDDAGDAAVEPRLDGLHVADAAAELRRDGDGFEDGVDRIAVHRLAGEGAVEVDDVQVVEALVLKRARLRGRVVVEHGGGVHLAELEAHALAVFEVDGREEDHGVKSRVEGLRRTEAQP